MNSAPSWMGAMTIKRFFKLAENNTSIRTEVTGRGCAVLQSTDRNDWWLTADYRARADNRWCDDDAKCDEESTGRIILNQSRDS